MIENHDKFNLQFLIRQPSKYSAISRAVILLHGVGSNEKDLFGLATSFPNDFMIISPRAPIALGGGRYAWYEVDFSTGRPLFNEEQEIKSRRMLADFIITLKRAYQIDELFVGGFSQGGIMSYSIGLIWPGLVNGIFALSSRILSETTFLVKNSEALQKLPVFIAHGIQDLTLPVLYAREAKAYLQQMDIYVSYHEYEMGHQITNAVLSDLILWLNETTFNPENI